MKHKEVGFIIFVALIVRAIVMIYSDNYPGSVIFRLENSSRYLLGIRSILESCHLPLYNLIIIPLLKFIPNYTIVCLRVLALSFSMLALIQYYRLTSLISKPFIALSSLVIISFYPLDLYHSLVPTEHSLFLLLSYSFLFYSLNFYRHKSIKDFYKSLSILFIGITCRYEFWVIGTLSLPLLWSFPLTKFDKRNLLLVIPFLLILLWIIISPGSYDRITTNNTTYYIPSSFLERFLLWPLEFYKSLGVVFLSLAGIGSCLIFRRSPQLIIFLTAYIAFLIISTTIGRVELNNRYMILPLTLIFPIMLSAVTFPQIPKKMASLLIFGIIFYHAYYSFNRYDIIRPKQYEITTMIKYFKNNSSHEKACNIFFDESGGSFLFHHYFLAHNCIQYIDRYIFISATKEKFARIYNDLMTPLLTKKFEYIMTRHPDNSSFFSEMKGPSGNIIIGKDLQYRPVHQFHSHLLYRRIPQDRED